MTDGEASGPGPDPSRPVSPSGVVLVVTVSACSAAAIMAVSADRWLLAMLLAVVMVAAFQAFTISGRLRRRIDSAITRCAVPVSGSFRALRRLVVVPTSLLRSRTARHGHRLTDGSTAGMVVAAGAGSRSGAGRGPVRLMDRRWARAVVAATVLVAITAPVLVLARRLVSRGPAPSPTAAVQGIDPSASAALSGRGWVQEAGAEIGRLTVEDKSYTPFTGTSLRDFSGRYVNVQNRIRRSYEPPIAPGVRPLEIWFFGGSTMFGFAMQRDEHTIPSEFARLAERAGMPVRVRNYGTTAATNYSETVLLSLLLTAGERPDLVVFYDGINDWSLQLLNYFGGVGPSGEPGELGAFQVRDALAAEQGYGRNPPSRIVPRPRAGRPDAGELVSDIVDAYGQGVGLARSLGGAYGFPVVHFWQPDLLSKARLDPGERALLAPLGFDDFRFDALADLLAEVRTRLPAGVEDISSALDGTSGPVLTDIVHTNEEGARAVAGAMFGRLGEVLSTPGQRR